MTSAMMVSMLAGCGSTGGETTTPEGGETAESGDGYNMTLIMSLRDEFLSTLEAGAQAAAEERRASPWQRRMRRTTPARCSSSSSLHAMRATMQF